MRHKIIKMHLNDHNVHIIYKKINTYICFDFETLKVGLASNPTVLCNQSRESQSSLWHILIIILNKYIGLNKILKILFKHWFYEYTFLYHFH